MPTRGPLLTLVVALCLSFTHVASANDAGTSAPGTTDQYVDAGIPMPPDVTVTPSGSGSAGSDASSPTSPPSSVDPQDPESLAKAAYRAVTTKNWFLLAGAILSGVALVVNWLLAKKWGVFGNSKVKWTVTGALAGLGAVATAWLADVPIASSTTLMGAIKVFAAAVFTYVSSKKLMASGEKQPV